MDKEVKEECKQKRIQSKKVAASKMANWSSDGSEEESETERKVKSKASFSKKQGLDSDETEEEFFKCKPETKKIKQKLYKRDKFIEESDESEENIKRYSKPKKLQAVTDDSEGEDIMPRKRRSKKRQHQRFLDSSSDDSDEDQPRRSTKGQRMPRYIPKSISYDGKSNFAAFKMKFEQYVKAYSLTEEECKNCLCWCLTGKAAEYFTLTMEVNNSLSYRQLIKKLEQRFGSRELAETANVRFQQACQGLDESLEDWADRVLTLATKAFREVPDKYANQQAITRFCSGLYDKPSAQNACVQRHKTMEGAIDYVKWYQHVHQAVYGKSKPTRFTREDPPHVYETSAVQQGVSGQQFQEMMNLLKETRVTRDKAKDHLQVIPQGASNDQFRQMMDMLKEMSSGTGVGRGRGRGTARKDGCFHCGQPGHIRLRCPLRLAERTCYKCNKQGHIQRDCPENGNGTNNLNWSPVSIAKSDRYR
ncbi:uncharacterized protein LOC132745399 [Ruditapes philippinarum]|uniref:uncharacterized protein LOC132745399 n=1 Tax=Ruditapes philippinarum TaxID=129788 RepID=UPI00295ACD65|nr:uncharacterized protein LOC132745399 [Ruditapes philippinarum]